MRLVYVTIPDMDGLGMASYRMTSCSGLEVGPNNSDHHVLKERSGDILYTKEGFTPGRMEHSLEAARNWCQPV